MQKITPCLWFDTQAEEAVRFYTSVLKDAKIGAISHYGEGAPLPAGTVLTITFTLAGQEFMALNGGPMFKFTPAISFIINCESQAEVDRYWERLSEGGTKERCGWLRDKYNVSWQIVPAMLGEWMRDPDPVKTARVMQAVLTMDKLNIAALEAAHEG